MKSKKPKTKDEAAWKTTERIVYALEKYITEDFKVERDIWLPVINSQTGEERQFDIVLTLNNGRKTTRYVVEVQKRNKKVNINDFHGWVQKMRSVDCQHLICVSTKGFPASVIEQVRREYGTKTVTLMTLDDFETLVDPETKVNINFDSDSFKWAMTNKRWKTVEMSPVRLTDEAKRHNLENIKLENDVFLYHGQKFNYPKLMEAILFEVTNKPDNLEKLKTGDDFIITLRFKEKDNLYVILGEEKEKILEWTVKVQIFMYDIKFDVQSRKYAYRYVIDNETLAWICSTTLNYERRKYFDDDEMKFQNKDDYTLEKGRVQIDFICKMVNGKMEWRLHEHPIKRVS